jgi:ectoine hydroxylase-related dioxygenase (phytanoyl-CoA dioxygenase family)
MTDFSTQLGSAPGWLTSADCRVSDLAALVNDGAAFGRPAHAVDLSSGIPVYDCQGLRPRLEDPGIRATVLAEWRDVMSRGAGVLVLSRAFDGESTLTAATTQFNAMIEEERGSGSGGDHFARAGANDRVWNALEKLCTRAPEAFASYYANDMLALICLAWLGPGYQVTSQVNCVNPGGAAQSPHRDFHLGFCTPEQAMRYPAQVHRMSPWLTLQGAVAHVDMPIESGPTLLLPHSQKFDSGYLVAGRPEFDDFFATHHVQLPLKRGDAVFFNPALIHAAGRNVSSDVRRMANLLQVSSAFGRSMESVNRVRMSLALYPVLLERTTTGRRSEGRIDRSAQHEGFPMTMASANRAIAACAEGYAFPTNLDRDPPLGGLAPQSQQGLMQQALAERWEAQRFATTLLERQDRRGT